MHSQFPVSFKSLARSLRYTWREDPTSRFLVHPAACFFFSSRQIVRVVCPLPLNKPTPNLVRKKKPDNRVVFVKRESVYTQLCVKDTRKSLQEKRRLEILVRVENKARNNEKKAIERGDKSVRRLQLFVGCEKKSHYQDESENSGVHIAIIK